MEQSYLPREVCTECQARPGVCTSASAEGGVTYRHTDTEGARLNRTLLSAQPPIPSRITAWVATSAAALTRSAWEVTTGAR